MDVRNKPRFLIAEEQEIKPDDNATVIMAWMVESATFVVLGVGFLVMKYHKPITLWINSLVN